MRWTTRYPGWIWLCIIPSGLRARGAAGIRPGAGKTHAPRDETPPVPHSRTHHHVAGCTPTGEEGCPMNSIVYLVGAVVIIGFVLKMMGVY